MHKLRSTLLISLLLIFLSACAPANVAPSVTLSPVSTTPLVEVPTFTPKPTASRIPTVTPILTNEPADQILYSPDGEYVAKRYDVNRHPAFEEQVIEILNKQGSSLWQIPYQGDQTEMGEPYPSLRIYEWSNDSSALYFYYEKYPDGGGDYAFWWTGFDLQRIDIATGDIAVILPGTSAFAISPDTTQIAYTRAQDNPSIIFVRDLLTGAEKTAYVQSSSKNYIRVGDIYWSPNGKELVFHTETENDEPMVQTIYLNVTNMRQKVIKEYEAFSYTWFSGWSDDGVLLFVESGDDVQVDPHK